MDRDFPALLSQGGYCTREVDWVARRWHDGVLETSGTTRITPRYGSLTCVSRMPRLSRGRRHFNKIYDGLSSRCSAGDQFPEIWYICLLAITDWCFAPPGTTKSLAWTSMWLSGFAPIGLLVKVPADGVADTLALLRSAGSPPAANDQSAILNGTKIHQCQFLDFM